jgi:mono/diheme cytochrome c family protein
MPADRAHGLTRVAARRLAHGALLGTVVATMSACSWFTAFDEQPKIDPWEILGSIKTPQRGNPQMSVPIQGTFAAGFQVSYQPLPATIDSMSSLQNPTQPTEASLANGRKIFQINCSPCHGEAGMGNGLATRYGVPGISIIYDHTKGLTDGYIFGMIRNGRGAMPPYNRIEDVERWDVVNYVRGLQGKYPVVKGAVGYPGQTGDALPGYTLMAPTRPSPVAWSGSGAFGADSTHAIKAGVVGASHASGGAGGADQ